MVTVLYYRTQGSWPFRWVAYTVDDHGDINSHGVGITQRAAARRLMRTWT